MFAGILSTLFEMLLLTVSSELNSKSNYTDVQVINNCSQKTFSSLLTTRGAFIHELHSTSTMSAFFKAKPSQVGIELLTLTMFSLCFNH